MRDAPMAMADEKESSALLSFQFFLRGGAQLQEGAYL
jgi:hypothetical protein